MTLKSTESISLSHHAREICSSDVLLDTACVGREGKHLWVLSESCHPLLRSFSVWLLCWLVCVLLSQLYKHMAVAGRVMALLTTKLF